MSETNEENKEKNNDCGDGSSAFETGSITVEKSGHFIHCSLLRIVRRLTAF